MYASLCDCTSADDQISVIQHHSLTGRDSPLRLVKFHSGKTIFFRVHGRRLFKLGVAGLGCNTHSLRQRFKRIPVPIVRPQRWREEGFVGTDGDGVMFHILGTDVHRLSHGKAQPLALPLCVAGSAPVVTYHLFLKVQEISLGKSFPV